MKTTNTSQISGFTILIERLCTAYTVLPEKIEGLLGTALNNYSLYPKRHEISYSKLLEIWERDCEPEMVYWSEAA